MIRNRGREISGERIFNNFKGILLGPIDFPVLNKSIISDISYGAAGDIKKKLGFCYQDNPLETFGIWV